MSVSDVAACSKLSHVYTQLNVIFRTRLWRGVRVPNFSLEADCPEVAYGFCQSVIVP